MVFGTIITFLCSCGDVGEDNPELTPKEERIDELEGTLAGDMINELYEALLHALPGERENSNALPGLTENHALPGAVPSALPGAIPSVTAKLRNKNDIDVIVDVVRKKIIEINLVNSDDEDLLLRVIIEVLERN
jgi:hypothetical protein